MTRYFNTALTDQRDRVNAANDALGHAKTPADAIAAASLLEAAFSDALKGVERANACSIERVRRQAKLRAESNGAEPDAAADMAEAYVHEGMSHEAAVQLAAGKYRRAA